MSQGNTLCRRLALTVALAVAAVPVAPAQTLPPADWRPVGNTLQLRGLPSPAGGPVVRVWFAEAGLNAQLPDGRVFTTTDFEAWTQSDAAPPAVPESPLAPPERGAAVVAVEGDTLLAAGSSLWRSDDAGRHWRDLTSYRGASILGGPVLDASVLPQDATRLAVASVTGVWMSHDGGVSWAGINEGLPNLPVTRLISSPTGARGMRIAIDGPRGPEELEWVPGQRNGWLPSQTPVPAEQILQTRISVLLGLAVTAAAESGDSVFAGTADGRLWASLDAGRSWRAFATGTDGSRVSKLWPDPADPRFALASLSGAGGKGPRIFRTTNGGIFWDDLTSNLPDAAVRGIAADRNSGAIYAATSRGLYWTLADLRAPAPATAWSPVPGNLPAGPVRDVLLDPSGTRLYAALDSAGVLVTPAPHRFRSPVPVHSADYGLRPAAPGALLSIIGSSVARATANRLDAPVLAATPMESQIQIPFEVSGDSLQILLSGSAGDVSVGLPLRRVSPSILVDRDGTPLLLDAESGIQLDAMNPARGGMLVQILAGGLGRVQPQWPTGLPAPLENVPRVVSPVRVLLGGAALEVTRATLAPGYVGYYLVEVRLPEFLNAGLSELLVESEGNQSNRVRVYIDR